MIFMLSASFIQYLTSLHFYLGNPSAVRFLDCAKRSPFNVQQRSARRQVENVRNRLNHEGSSSGSRWCGGDYGGEFLPKNSREI